MILVILVILDILVILVIVVWAIRIDVVFYSQGRVHHSVRAHA